MFFRTCFVGLLIGSFLSFFPSSSSARDPHPRKVRIKNIVAPYSALGADPKTLLRPDGKRSDIISFSCRMVIPGNKIYNLYLNDIAIDTYEKAKRICDGERVKLEAQFGYLKEYVIRKPYLKNNKNVGPDEEKYDAYGYEWPIGDYLDSTSGNMGFEWATPLVYGGLNGVRLQDSRCRGGECSCYFLPGGPRETWVKIAWGDSECFAPPYTASGPWWDWLVGQIENIRNGIDMERVAAVGIFLGIDGEGRPLKSQDNWSPVDMSLTEYRNRFYYEYVPAVVREIKKRYPGKVIRAHTDDPEIILYLENDIDFHRESLNADGVHDYMYKGLPTFGWWQGFANRYYMTNSIGLQGWRPLYQTLLAGLAQHTDHITGFTDLFDGLYQDGKGDFIKFLGSYIGKNIHDTPGVWSYLRETQYKKEGTNVSGKYGDYDYYLYRAEDLYGNKTVPVLTDELPPGTSRQIYNWGLPSVRWQLPTGNMYVGRKNAPGNRYMNFDIDDGYRYAKLPPRPGLSYDIRIVFLDAGTGTFKLQYKDEKNEWVEKLIPKTNTQLWKEVTLTVDDAFFSNNASEGPNAQEYPTDFRIDSGDLPLTLHLIEVRGKGEAPGIPAAKAQVSCDIIRNPGDDPQEGTYSVGLNQSITVRAKITDDQGRPLAYERVMFTYNTEWNLAKSAVTDANGVAYQAFRTANRLDSSGFSGAESSRLDKPSYYTFQVYYPGSRNYQPSRNDCGLQMTNSAGPADPLNVRMRITGVDTSRVSSSGRVLVAYQIFNNQGRAVATGSKYLGKAEGFYADDPNLQTLPVTWITGDWHAAFNNVTMSGIGSPIPAAPQGVK